MAIITIPPAERGEIRTVERPSQDDTLSFDFPLETAGLVQRGNDLVILSQEGGAIIVKDFYVQGENAGLPSILSAGEPVAAQSLAAAARPLIQEEDTGSRYNEDDIEVYTGGQFSIADDLDTINGVDRLGSLGTDQFGQDLEVALERIDEEPEKPAAEEETVAQMPAALPTLQQTEVTLIEDAPNARTWSGSVLAGATPGEGEGTFQWTDTAQAARYGTLVRLPDGQFSYSLNNADPVVQGLGVGEKLVETFSFSYTDAAGQTVTNTLIVTILGTNDAPQVAAATASVAEDSPAIFGVLPTPTDVDVTDTHSFIPQTNTAGTYGTLTLNADGSYTYALNNASPLVQSLGVGETVRDTFTYTVSDGHGGTATNTLTVTITGTNDAPQVAAAPTSVTEDSSITASGVLPAPTDADGSDTPAFIPQPGTAGTHGTLTLQADGRYTYALNNASPVVQSLALGEAVTDTFTYMVSDGRGGTATNTLTVTITGTNDAPQVAEAAAAIVEDTPEVTGVLPTPTDVDVRDTLLFIPQTNTAGTYGTLTLQTDGSYSYALNTASPLVQSLGVGETATDTFTYTVSDGQGGTATNTLTVTVTGTNDAPQVAAAADIVTEDSSITASGVLPAPTDADGSGTPAFIPQTNTAGTYGSLTLQADGSYTYALNNASPLVQSLGVGETATDTFTYTVSDGQGGTATNTLIITINGTNDIPHVAAVTDSVTEDVRTTASGVLPTPTDADVNDLLPFTAQTNTAGTYGNLTLQADGSYTYTLNNASPLVQSLSAGETTRDTFTYTASDGHGGTATNTLTVTVTGTNDIPQVAATAASIAEDTPTLTGTVSTPTDVDVHDTLLFTPQTGAAGTYGNLTLRADGSYTYALNNASPLVQSLGVGERVTETFSYTVNDGQGGTATNTLTITITGTNDAPRVAAATDSVTEDVRTTTSGVLPVPTDVDVDVHDTPAFIPQTNKAGTYGNLTLQADGSYTYTLNNASPLVQSLGVGETARDTFTYTVSDGHGGTATNTLTVTVTGTNDAPQVAAATDSVTEDARTTASGTLPAPTDVDVHDTPAFIPQTNTAGTYGSLTLQADGSYTYALNNASPLVQSLGRGETATDTFTYTVSDGQGGTATNTLTITITGTNDAPRVATATDSVTEDVRTTTSGVLPAPTDVDAHDAPAFIPQNISGVYGVLTLGADGAYTYMLNNALPAVQALGVGQTARDTFIYTVSDGHGGTVSSSLTMTINGTNDAPTIGPARDTLVEDRVLTASGRVPTPQDVDTGDTAHITPQSGTVGMYGTLTLGANGNYTYTLNNAASTVQSLGQGQTATESFTYTVSDGHGGTGTNTLTLTIMGTNDNPRLVPAATTVYEDAPGGVSGTLPAPVDPDTGDTTSFVPLDHVRGLYGTLAVQADGSYTYMPDNSLAAVQALGVGDSLSERFSYTVLDNHGAATSASLTVTIQGTNDTPVAVASAASVVEDSRLTVSGVLSVTDVDLHDAQAYTPLVNQQGQYGTITIGANGSYTYTLNNTLAAVQGLGVGESLTDTFHTTVNDGHGGTALVPLTIVVNGTNDAPTVAPLSVPTSSTIQGSLPASVDIDVHDTPAFLPQSNVHGLYGTLSITPQGTYSYTVDQSLDVVRALGVGAQVSEAFTYVVNDGHGGIGYNTLTVSILGTNDAPQVGATAAAMTTPVSILNGVLATPTDIDTGDAPTFVAQTATPGRYGTLNLAADGSYRYVVDTGLLTYTKLREGQSLTETFTYSVTDGHGGTASNTLTIQLQGPANDGGSCGLRALPATDSVTEDSATVATGVLPDPDNASGKYTYGVDTQVGTYGTLTVAKDGSYTYTLNNASAAVQGLGAGQQATDVFTYSVRSRSETDTATISITVRGTNDGPIISPATVTVQEDTTLVATGIMAATDPDSNGSLVLYDAASIVGTYGRLVLNANGTYTYILNTGLPAVQSLGAGEHATETFTITGHDIHGGMGTATLAVSVAGRNDVPTVAGASATTQEDALVPVTGVLPAPRDVDAHDTPTFTPMPSVAGQYGTFTIAADGSYSYIPNAAAAAVQSLGVGESVRDTVVYTVTDGHGGTATNTLTITITGANDAPTVAAATGFVAEDGIQNLSGMLPRPTDPDAHDTPRYVDTTVEGQYGTLTIGASGQYTYVLHNDSSVVQSLGAGALASEVFTYTVTDGHGGTATNTLTVTVQGTNDQPSVASATASVTDGAGADVSGHLPTSVDIDAGDILAFVPIASQVGQYGTLQLDATGAYHYTLNHASPDVSALGVGETATDTFTYTVNDGHGGTASNTLTITVTGVNDIPLPAASVAESIEDVTLTASGVLPLPTDLDVDDTLAFVPQAETPGQYGAFTLSPTGVYTYVLHNGAPAVQALGVGETATDTFTYTVTDNHGATSTSTLTVLVHGTNDIPTVAAATASVAEDLAPVASGALPTPVDTDSHDTLLFTPQVAQPGLYGTLTLAADGHYTYSLATSLPVVQALGAGETMTETFSYTVSDGHGGTATNTLGITINGTNDAPVAVASVAESTEDVTLTASGVLPTPTDLDVHDMVSFVPQAETPGQYGAFTLSATGVYTYVLHNGAPAVQALGAGETATDTFTYTVTDTHGETSTSTLTVLVHGTNDIPTVAAATAAVTEDLAPAASGALPSPVDVDSHDTPQFAPQTAQPGLYGTFTLAADGHYTYSLATSLPVVQALGAGETATDTFSYTVDDGHGGTATNAVSVTVYGADPAPEVVGPSLLSVDVAPQMLATVGAEVAPQTPVTQATSDGERGLEQEISAQILQNGLAHSNDYGAGQAPLLGGAEPLLAGHMPQGGTVPPDVLGIAPVPVPVHAGDVGSGGTSPSLGDVLHQGAGTTDHLFPAAAASAGHAAGGEEAAVAHSPLITSVQQDQDDAMQQEVDQHIVRNHSS